MVMLYCEECGAPLDRSEEEKLRHRWTYADNHGITHVGLMVAYPCTAALAANRINDFSHRAGKWGKLRVVTYPTKER